MKRRDYNNSNEKRDRTDTSVRAIKYVGEYLNYK